MEWVDRGDLYKSHIEEALDFWMPYVTQELEIPLKRPAAGAYYPRYHGDWQGSYMRFYDREETGTIAAAGDYRISQFTILEQTLHELGHAIMYQHGDRSLKESSPNYPYLAEGGSEALWFEGIKAAIKEGHFEFAPVLARRALSAHIFGRSPFASWYTAGYLQVQRLRSEGAQLQDILMHPEWFIEDL